MGAAGVFILRLVLAIFFALLAGWIFFAQVTVIKVAGLALALLGFAYLFEYVRKRDQGEKHGN